MAPTLAMAFVATALAGHPGYRHGPPSAFLTVENDFAGNASLYLNGSFAGRLDGFEASRKRLRPGRYDAEVRHPETGFLLASGFFQLRPYQQAHLRVPPPPAVLSVTNRGGAPVRLVGALGRHTLLPPGATVRLDVTAGPVEVRAAIADPRGDFLVHERTVWADPGTVTHEVVRPEPPSIRVVNREPMPVRVLVDGRSTDVVLRPGQVRQIFLRPGAARLTFTDLRGRPRGVDSVFLRGCETTDVVIDARRGPRHRPGYRHPHSGSRSGPVVYTRVRTR